MCACQVTSVVSDSLQHYGPWPTRLPWPWGFPGKNSEVGCHSFLQGDLPDPGTKPTSPASPALAGRFLIPRPPGKPLHSYTYRFFPRFFPHGGYYRVRSEFPALCRRVLLAISFKHGSTYMSVPIT